jgi:uncharacterized protein YndB with AHSA1/START domain
VSRIRTVAAIARSPADVFDYVTTPGHWPEWHPSSLRVTGTVDRSMQVGETCTEEFVVAGRRGSCTWTAREREPDRRWVIDTDAQGGRATISYTLVPTSEGTSFERVLEYRMPNALLGLLDVLVLRRRVTRESEEATFRLKARLEAAPRQAAVT